MPGFCHRCSSVNSIIDLATSIEPQELRHSFPAAVFHDVKGAFDSVAHDAVWRSLEGTIIEGFK